MTLHVDADGVLAERFYFRRGKAAVNPDPISLMRILQKRAATEFVSTKAPWAILGPGLSP